MEILLETANHFLDAHCIFYKLIANFPGLIVSNAPVDADKVHARYCVIQKGNTLHCEYQIDDRQYTKVEIKRFLKKIKYDKYNHDLNIVQRNWLTDSQKLDLEDYFGK